MKVFLLACLLVAHQSFGIASLALAQTIVAHRGASADAPENTLAAFRLAWEQNADAIEGDFYLTADRQIVCIHDATTERVSGVAKKVAESLCSELAELDVGSWKAPHFASERIPTFDEVLALVAETKVLFIEIKCGPEILPVLKQELDKCELPRSQFRIISFHERVIEEAQQLFTDIDAYWLVEFKWDEERRRWTPPLERAIGIASRIGADGLDVKANAAVLDGRFARLCQQAGLSYHAWTVDDPAIARQLHDLGFASITTNRPAVIRKALALAAEPAIQSEPAKQEAAAE